MGTLEDFYLALGGGGASHSNRLKGNKQCSLSIYWGSVPDAPPNGYQSHNLNVLVYYAAPVLKNLGTPDIEDQFYYFRVCLPAMHRWKVNSMIPVP